MNAQDFLVKDYELKIRYLSDHFTRMWNRFNYFVGIQAALVSGKFFLHDGKDSKLSLGLAFVGLLLAFVWYIMGAEDRYLVQVYRRQVEDAGELVARAVLEDNSAAYCYVGEIEKTGKGLPRSLSAWRLKALSTTKLAAWIPLLLTVAWVGVLIREHH